MTLGCVEMVTNALAVPLCDPLSFELQARESTQGDT